nr:class II aldolase/adducin family protein [Bradyrhizobium sp. 180]
MSAAAWRGRSHHADPWHLAILNAYPQVKAVVHTHADRCVALSCLAETNVGLPFHGPRFWQKRCALCALRHVRRQSARRVSRRGAGTAQGLPIGEPRDDCHGQGAAGWLRLTVKRETLAAISAGLSGRRACDPSRRNGAAARALWQLWPRCLAGLRGNLMEITVKSKIMSVLTR